MESKGTYFDLLPSELMTIISSFIEEIYILKNLDSIIKINYIELCGFLYPRKQLEINENLLFHYIKQKSILEILDKKLQNKNESF